MEKYRVFKRSCRNWQEFASARKIKVRTGLSCEEAREFCRTANADLSPTQVRKGTKFEFEKE